MDTSPSVSVATHVAMEKTTPTTFLTPTLLVVLAETDGVCYLVKGARVVECAHLAPAYPDHSDIDWFVPADNEPDPTAVFEQRFLTYAAAIVTATVHTTQAERVFLYGDQNTGAQLIEHLPPPVRAHAHRVFGDAEHPPDASVAERMRALLLTSVVPYQPVAFGAP